MSLITITTGIACGGMATARRVAEELGMVLYDDDRLQEEAVGMGFSSEDMKSFDQTAPGLLTRLLRLRPAEYLELMAAAVYEVARRRHYMREWRTLFPEGFWMRPALADPWL